MWPWTSRERTLHWMKICWSLYYQHFSNSSKKNRLEIVSDREISYQQATMSHMYISSICSNWYQYLQNLCSYVTLSSAKSLNLYTGYHQKLLNGYNYGTAEFQDLFKNGNVQRVKGFFSQMKMWFLYFSSLSGFLAVSCMNCC